MRFRVCVLCTGTHGLSGSLALYEKPCALLPFPVLLIADGSKGMHAVYNKTPRYTGGAEGALTHGLGRLEPGSGAFGAALAAAERASVTPSRRVGRSLSHVSFLPAPPRQTRGNCVCTCGPDDVQQMEMTRDAQQLYYSEPILWLQLNALGCTWMQFIPMLQAIYIPKPCFALLAEWQQ